MKTLLAAILSLFLFLIPTGGNMKDCTVTFYKGGYISKSTQIIKTADDMNNYIDEILGTIKNNNFVAYEGYYEAVEKDIREFYSKYNAAFFSKNSLIIANIDTGSGSYKHSLSTVDYNATTGELNLTVTRETPLICTMDYVTWVMHLELKNSVYNVSSVNISLLHLGR